MTASERASTWNGARAAKVPSLENPVYVVSMVSVPRAGSAPASSRYATISTQPSPVAASVPKTGAARSDSAMVAGVALATGGAA